MKKVLSVFLALLMVLSMFTVLSGVALADAYSVTATAGGKATVEGQTYKAVPYYGNTFAGWYTADGTPVSTAQEFTTADYTSLEARFNVYNQIVDGSFENGTAGQEYFNQYSGSAAGKKNVIANAPTGSIATHGNKVLECVPTAGSTTNEYLLHIPVTVKKNTTYTFHLSYYMPGYECFSYIGVMGSGFANAYTAHGTLDKWSLHWQKEGTNSNGGWSYMGNQSPSTFWHRTVNSNIGIDADTWIDVLVVFDTGDDASIFADGSDTATVYIQFGTANSNTNSFYIDNVCFSEAAKTITDTEVTAEVGGYVEATSAPQKIPSPVVYYDTAGEGKGQTADNYIVADSTYYSVAKTSAQQYEAFPYSDNLFDGWYDENGALITKDTIVNIDAQKKATAKFVNNNQIADGNFSADKGVAAWQSYNGSRVVTIADGQGMDGKGANVAVGGNSMMAIKFPVSVKKNTDYVFSYNLKINSWAASGADSTPVYSQMISGSPSGDGSWGHWPSLNGWKITIRNAEDYSKSMVVTSTQKHCIPQTKFSEIVEKCGEDAWLEFILEFNTGSDTTQGSDGNLFATSDTANMFMALGFNFAVANIDYDNVCFYENNFTPNFVAKENVKISRVGIGTVAAGVPYNFKVEAAEDVDVTVKYNGIEAEPVNGVYSVAVTAENKDIVITTSNDEDYPEKGKDFDGNDLTKYDHEIYNKPIWEGDTVYHETVAFYGDRTEARLVYPIDDVISVRSFDLQTYYVKGVDFDVQDGKLVLLPGSSMPILGYLPLSPAGSGSWGSDIDGYDITGASGGSLYPKTVVVTYTHSKTWADLDEEGFSGIGQASASGKLDVIEKLENGEDVHIVFYGDSMTSGWSISGGKTDVYTAANNGTTDSSGLYTAPYAPSWMDMFIEGLKKEYPNANITAENLSLGGKASGWGVDNFEPRYNLLKNKDIDLFLIGWGINDAGGSVAPATFKSNEQQIINKVRNKCPNVSVLLYTGHCTNLLASMYDETHVLGYQEMVHELANENDNTAAVDLTNIFYEIMGSKESIDIFENNLNHTNDFGCRIYSQVMLSAMKYVHVHNYDNVKYDDTHHWTECDCGEASEKLPHEYNILDWDAEDHWYKCECGKDELPYHQGHGFTRKGNATHHWLECECGYKADYEEHKYDDDYDADCNVCEEIREVEIPALNGWVKEGANWKFYKNNVAQKGWQKDGGKWYYLDLTTGYMVTNKWMKDSTGWVYLGSSGAMLTNAWCTDSQGWCYVGANGYAVTNCWKKDSKGWIWLNANGSMTKNKWIEDGGKWYYLDANGYMVTNKWMKDSKGWCYLGSSGAMATNAWVRDSIGWCYVGADGYAVTNCWKKDSTGWCYLNSNGSMVKNNWVQDGGKWYFLDKNGYMVTNKTVTISGKAYKFNASGVCLNP